MSTDDPVAETLEEPMRASNSAWNIGYFYLHHSALPAIAHWKAMCEENPTLWDQNLFKDIFKIGKLRFGLPHRCCSSVCTCAFHSTLPVPLVGSLNHKVYRRLCEASGCFLATMVRCSPAGYTCTCCDLSVFPA